MKLTLGNNITFAMLLFLSYLQHADATLVATNGGALVADTTNNLTWASDARLIKTLADASGDSAAFFDTVIAAAGGVIYDTPTAERPTGTYYLSSADYAGVLYGRATWYGALAFVAYLNSIAYEGYSDWRLPTTNPALSEGGLYPDGLGLPNSLPISSSELALLLYGNLGQVREQWLADVHNENFYLFTNLDGGALWSGTEYPGNYNAAYFLSNYSGWASDNGMQGVVAKYEFQFKFLPVRSGYSIAAIPEPGTLALLGLGLAGLGLSRRRKA